MKTLFKTVCLCLCALCLLAALPSCGILKSVIYGLDYDLGIPKGYISKVENMEKDAFQDSTDFCIYVYPEGTDIFEKDGAYRALTAPAGPNDENKQPVDEIAAMDALFTDFERFLALDEERAKDFDFDHACISAGDLYRVVKTTSQEGLPEDPVKAGGTSIDGYSIWFFDKESSTLYYIHANT